MQTIDIMHINPMNIDLLIKIKESKYSSIAYNIGKIKRSDKKILIKASGFKELKITFISSSNSTPINTHPFFHQLYLKP